MFAGSLCLGCTSIKHKLQEDAKYDCPCMAPADIHQSGGTVEIAGFSVPYKEEIKIQSAFVSCCIPLGQLSMWAATPDGG